MSTEGISLPIGQRILLPGQFDVAVTLEDARPLGTGYECRLRLPDGSLEEAVISLDEAKSLALEPAAQAAAVEPVPIERFRLLVESARIRLAYAHDPQFAVSVSGIRTLPHQIDAVYQRMLPQPCLRFLLADDPGAGKTIMAGLLIKEMRLREAIERVLILCPAPLTIQWQDELLRWFGESFDIVFSAVDQQQLTNPWERNSSVIASLDYAKQDDVRERVWQQHWDLVIIDEAHKCSARTTSGGKDREPKVDATKRYELAWRLTGQADHVLLLTATPHHGNDDHFGHFLRLIDRDLFPEPHRLQGQAASIRTQVLSLGDESPWAVRRLKEDLRDLDGGRLFPDRHAVTVPFIISAEEYDLYKAVTAYINQYMPHQIGGKRSSSALARTVLQRRLASSARAIHESLKRRHARQQEIFEKLEAMTPAERTKHVAALQRRMPDAEIDDDDLDDEARDELVDSYLGDTELDRLAEEIAALTELIEQARKVREGATDSKLAALRECLARAEFSELEDGRGKLLIFTEHRDTVDYLCEQLGKWGYTTCEIRGGMNPHERKAAQELFRTQRQVCVATEAAGEGINLQFCHLMINYDMPWNPTRLEQRLGRIHRIGQDRDVYAYNFVATESEDGQPIIEGRILQRLLEKIDQMKAALSERVFDVIGEVLAHNDVNLADMLREAAHHPHRLDEYTDQIERIDPRKLEEYEKATGIALARGHVDFSRFQRQNLEVEERRLMPRYVEDQFVEAAKQIGLRVEPRADGLWRIEHVLAELRSEKLAAVRHFGKPESSYRKVTFHKAHLEQDAHLDAELMGPGHRLFAAVDEKLRERLAPVVGGVCVCVDAMADSPYRLHFFEMSIRGKDTNGNDVPLHAEVVAVREELGGHTPPGDPSRFEVVPGDSVLDLAPCEAPSVAIEAFDSQAAADYLKTSYQLERRTVVQADRQRHAKTVREYLEKSFAARIRRAQDRAMELNAQASSKPEYQIAASEATKQVAELERARDDRIQRLARLETARTGPLQHLGTALVFVPGADVAAQMARVADELDVETRKRTELAAEDRVIAALVAEGFAAQNIERVGRQKIGFDIRAHRVVDEVTGALEVRRIEVKGRAKGQPIRLTTNEWYKAQQLAETYWLAVVWDPLTSPELIAIQHPAQKLGHATREVIAERYYEVPAAAIRGLPSVQGSCEG